MKINYKPAGNNLKTAIKRPFIQTIKFKPSTMKKSLLLLFLIVAIISYGSATFEWAVS